MAEIIISNKRMRAVVGVDNFHPCGDARYVWDNIKVNGKMGEFEHLLDLMFGEKADADELISFLIWQSDYIYFSLGLFDLCKTDFYRNLIAKH